MMAATRCIKCTKPLTTGGQYCDDCRPTEEDAPFKATPSAMTALAGCPTCGRPYDGGTRFCAFCDHQTRTEAGVEYGGFWIRLLAYLIDGFIVSIFTTIFLLQTESAEALFWFPIIVWIAYEAGFVAASGATPGKHLLGLRVLQANGEPAGLGTGLLRIFGYWVNGLTFGIGFLMVAFTAEKRGLHDNIAGTIVVRVRKQQTVEPHIG
jgi:uncharacterized RDD family membrane protein YckC